jgi:hypothetical protein
MQKDPGLYIRHILEAIAYIEADIAGLDLTGFGGSGVRDNWLRQPQRLRRKCTSTITISRDAMTASMSRPSRCDSPAQEWGRFISNELEHTPVDRVSGESSPHFTYLASVRLLTQYRLA